MKCDKCPTCLAHTHDLPNHKCDRLIALLYRKNQEEKKIVREKAKGKGGQNGK